MARATLTEVSPSFFEITVGRKQVGQIVKGPKAWVARYRYDGVTIAMTADSCRAAFMKVMARRNDIYAKKQGFNSIEELNAYNSRVQAENSFWANALRSKK